MAEDPVLRATQKTHNTMTTESLRQRQLDRLAPRGVPARDTRVTAATREVQDAVSSDVKLAAPPRAKQLGRAKTGGGGSRIKRLNEDTFGPQSAHNRPERLYGDDYTVESTGAGKEGRPFTVSNVGNNGRIYLRYVTIYLIIYFITVRVQRTHAVLHFNTRDLSNDRCARPSIRSAHQRYQQPQFAFPLTPPSTGGLDALLASNPEGISYRDRTSTTTPSLSTTPVKSGSYISTTKTAKAPTNRHRRAHSYSTVDEQHGAIQDSDVGAFKVVIERPSPDGRPKTSGGQIGTPALEVPIPSYKLGTPRFSIRGTPFMYGSSYAGTEVEYRSSFMSQTEADMRAKSRRSSLPKGPFSARQSIASHPGDVESTYELRLPPTGMSRTSPNLMSKQPIVPEMFDALTFLPQCEDRSVIRRTAGTDLITSATPARLIAEVTQELSYDLVASFFITYRSYISGSDLLALVMARLQWGIDKIVDGLIVTVRCFTVIRHWLVNFFADDFVLDYDLRVQFCDLVNSMVKKHALLQTNSKTTNDILSNIKRLWRDSCAVYWDGPEFAYDLDALVPIAPGGIAGSRDPHLTPRFWEELVSSKAPRLEPEESQYPAIDLETEHDSSISSTHRFFASIPLEYPAEFDRVRQQQATVTVSHQSHLSSESVSPQSIMSVEALSCSIPPLSKSAQISAGTAMAAHPVSTFQAGSKVPVAHAPKTIRPRSYRPGQGFQRHRSVSNSSRPDRTQEAYAQEVVGGDTELTFVNRFAGSLVRGLVFLPGQAYLPVGDPANSRPASLPNKKACSKPDAGQTSHGMKRMFGTVRRAVINKSEPSPKSPTQIIFPHLSLPPDQYGSATYLHGPTGAPQSPLQNPRKPIIMRPDKLSQFVESDFEKVVMQHKEDISKVHERSEPWVRRINVNTGSDFLRRSIDKTTLAACTTPLPELLPDPEDLTRIRDNTSFLFDGARDGDAPDDPDDVVTMSGALPTHTSTDAFINVFNGQSVAPTPPVTPPERFPGPPRHPSQLLGGYGPSSIERTPSLALDSRSPQSDLEERSQSKPLGHPSMRSYGKVYKPRRSTSLRRIASFHSGYTRHMSERSFDATTFSDSGDRASMVSTHAPGNRVLRRRPGGDLRALQNVGELPLKRHRSSGSLTTYSDSMRSSYLLDRESAGYVNVASSDDMPQDGTHTFSLGALADPESTSRPHISVFRTSSKPVMRPSFQAEAAKLAQIPDDVDDDGGVESALLKLEGKYEQRNSELSPQSLSQNFIALTELDFEHAFNRDSGEETEKRRHRHDHVVEQTVFGSRRASEVNELGEHSYVAEEYELQPTVYQPPPESFSLSRDSQNSIPLLQRDHSQYGTDDRESRNWTLHSVLRGPSQERNTERHHNSQLSQTSIDFVGKTESLNNIPTGETLPRYMSANESFLQTDDDDISDLSSEMSLEVISNTEFPGNISTNTFPPIQPGTIITEIAIPPTSRVSHGPSMTMQQALLMSPSVKQSAGALPLTPDVTPTYSQTSNNLAMRSWYSDDQLDAHQRQNIAETIFNGPLYVEDHMPFILYFDSNLIAQQFTLIEKETLGEIHFKELLEMKWSHEAASASQSWPRFLQSLKRMEENDTVSHGIEICGARSSIMTQWAISQIILTKNITERSRTIAKLIHIAMHCRKLGNYATLFQLTIALSNQLIAELHETWTHVPAADLQSLREFEELIQPANNFHRLRDEMESVLGKRACIPLVAIYAKDLTALKDMPSYIASTPTDPPLINVSKCRAQAAVVQLFSRYLESSTGYRFQTVPGLTERCLWIAGLSQAEIRGHAERLI